MTTVIVVGAGMAGLTAARRLVADGCEVTVLDKGRAVGGRMATRTVGDAVFDHGAQHFSVRSPEFVEVVDRWRHDGIVVEWFRSQSITQPGRGVEVRHAGAGGMRRIPEHHATGLEIHVGTFVEGIDVGDGDVAVIEEGRRHAADAVVLTPPLPQIAELVTGSDVTPDAGFDRRIFDVDYDPCLSVMATLDGPTGLAAGHLAPDDPIVAWVADNQHKKISPVPAVTIHSTPQYAGAHREEESDRWMPALVDRAERLIGCELAPVRGHRWKFSMPRTSLDTGCAVLSTHPPIVLAGEAFAGARVEGAFLSGLAAAAAVLHAVG